jgi:hypothetical protein
MSTKRASRKRKGAAEPAEEDTTAEVAAQPSKKTVSKSKKKASASPKKKAASPATAPDFAAEVCAQISLAQLPLPDAGIFASGGGGGGGGTLRVAPLLGAGATDGVAEAVMRIFDTAAAGDAAEVQAAIRAASSAASRTALAQQEQEQHAAAQAALQAALEQQASAHAEASTSRQADLLSVCPPARHD